MLEKADQDSAGIGCADNHSDTKLSGIPIDAALQPARRTFLWNVTATAAALFANACGGSSALADSGGQPSVVSHALVWDQIPPVVFTEGVAASFSIAAYVTDAESHVLDIAKNGIALPAGVTYDAAIKSFVYDGIGRAGSTGGHVLTASEEAG